jgi:hypothetical protein
MAIKRHMSPEQQRRTAEWCFRLKSGRYEQGRGYLHQIVKGKDLYCCLGVGAEYAVEEGVTDKVVVQDPETDGRELVKYGVLGEMGILPGKVAEWFGMSDNNPQVTIGDTSALGRDGWAAGRHSLAILNDNRVSFNIIADLIAKEWLDEPLQSEVLNYTPPEESDEPDE